MAQFDVHRLPGRSRSPRFVLDVQHDMFSHLKTRVVVPLIPVAEMRPMTRLNPAFVIDGETVAMSTTELAGIHVRDVGEKIISLADRRTDIVGALDYVFTGI